jgi:hypothetical protein
MGSKVSRFGVRAGAGWEEISRHLYHNFLTDVEGGHSVIDELADQRAGTIVRFDLFFKRLLIFWQVIQKIFQERAGERSRRQLPPHFQFHHR